MKKNIFSLESYNLFGRLLLIFFGLAVAIAFTFVFNFHYLINTDELNTIYKRNIVFYVEHLVAKLEIPPKKEQIKELSQQTSLSIGVYGKNFKFRTSEFIPTLEQLNDPSLLEDDFTSLEIYEFNFIKIEKDGYIFIVGLYDISPSLAKSILPLSVSILVSLLFVFLAYVFVGRLFSPLHQLKAATQEYAKGNFSYSVPIRDRGILSELSKSIQNMAHKIQSMLEGKRELLLAIAHELRTPITTANLHIEFLEDSDRKQKIKEELKEISLLITNLLESERLKDSHSILEKETIDLQDLCDELLNKYFPENQNIAIISSENVLIEIDPIKYGLALKNIIHNAVYYSDGTSIKIHITSSSISITDSGNGIPEDEIKNITEPFYRIEKSRGRKSGGVGLGLYLVKRIIEAHDHKLDIKSANGITVTIFFESKLT